MTTEKVAVVTAGGSGMGAGAARKLASDGFRVAILSSSGKGKDLAEEMGGIGVTGSNQSNEDLKRLVDQVVAAWGRIDVLVNSAGLAAYTKLFSDKYAQDNVRMNNVLPGFIDSLPEKQEFRDRIPMERYGKTEEIADVIGFLASEGAGYITGQNIRVDGGITRSV